MSQYTVMPEAPSAVLSVWSNFFVIMGSAAAALTALMFVAITLVAARPNMSRDGTATFSTPTVMHFCAALLTSALLTIPWRAFAPVAILLALMGAYGIGYAVRVSFGAARLASYRPEPDDWLWHAALPIVAYLTLEGGAIAVAFAPSRALFALAAAVVLLVFTGIHNAWDVVTYVAIEQDP